MKNGVLSANHQNASIVNSVNVPFIITVFLVHSYDLIVLCSDVDSFFKNGNHLEVEVPSSRLVSIL
jgi:hypothetical protein